MTNTDKNLVAESKKPLKFVVEGKEYETFDQYITGAELKQLAGIPEDVELHLSIRKPYHDELIENTMRVNLARPETEYFFVKRKLSFTIAGQPYVWYKQFISGKQLREIGNISPEDEIYLDLPNGWQDDFIDDDEIVDLARPGTEHFLVRRVPQQCVIYVNGREKVWNKRTITYEEVLKLAFPNISTGTVAYTVEYSGGPHQNPKGSMSKGDMVFVKNRMNFNADGTGRS
jgi:hypothetical protein